MAIQQAYDDFNKQSVHFASLSDAVIQARSGLADFALQYNGKVELDGKKVELNDSQVAEFRDAIMQGKTIDSKTGKEFEILQAIRKSGSDNVKEYHKVVEAVDNLLGDLRQANKKDKK